MGTASNSMEDLRDPRLIREQLDRILSHPLFSNSRRYPLLLREIVERALGGRAADAKERVLGVEVFGRDPGYDTSTDPIVRMTAGEIRKRLAQYYREPGHARELRILLPSGGYVPEFQLPNAVPEPAVADTAVSAAAETHPVPTLSPLAHPEPPSSAAKRWFAGSSGRILAGLSMIGALILIPGISWMTGERTTSAAPTALDKFWEPVVTAPGPVLILVGKPPREMMPVGNLATVPIGEAVTLSQISGLLGAKGKTFRLVNDSAATFSDLRRGPTVLIGGLKNEWTLRLLQDMRFYLDSDGVVDQIRDRKHPESHGWGNARVALQKDYALVSRLRDPTTGRMTVIAAGIYRYGSLAASEFLTDPQYLEQWAAEAPADWQNKNLQIVISTDVIDTHPGPPHVETFRLW